MFRIVVPLDDGYSFDAQIGKAQNIAQLKRNDDCALIEVAVMEDLGRAESYADELAWGKDETKELEQINP